MRPGVSMGVLGCPGVIRPTRRRTFPWLNCHAMLLHIICNLIPSETMFLLRLRNVLR